MSRVALFGFDEWTSGSSRWYADNLDFEVVAIADTDPDQVRRLAADLEVPLYSSLQAMFEEVRFDTLMVTQPLDAAKQATAYAGERGVRVHCEIVPEDSVCSARIVLLLGDRPGGGFETLHVTLPRPAGGRAMDDAIKHGVRVVRDVLPETTLAEALGSSVPAIAITIDGPDTSWEVHLCHHSERDLVSVILVEIRPGQPPWVTACWSAPHTQSRGDLLGEASRLISIAGRS